MKRFYSAPAFAIYAILLILLLSIQLVLGVEGVVYNHDLASLLLTSASLTFVVLSLLIAVVAVLGWKDIVTRVSEQVTSEQSGRVHFATGLMFGRVSRTDKSDDYVVDRKDLLELAISHTNWAVDRLEVGTNLYWSALNNLGFYYSLQKGADNSHRAVEIAQDLLRQYGRTNEPRYLNTYASILAVYAKDFPDMVSKLGDCRRILQHLAERESATATERKNARRHLIRVERALQEAGMVLDL